MPAGESSAGYITPYLNLWTATQTPAQALLRILSSAVAPKGGPRYSTPQVKSVKTSAALKGIVEGRLEMEWGGTRRYGRDAAVVTYSMSCLSRQRMSRAR